MHFYFVYFPERCWYSSSSFNLPCLSVTSDSLHWKRGCYSPPDSQWITLASDRCQAWQTCCSFRRTGDYTESERYSAVRVHLQIHNLEAPRDGFKRFLVIINECTYVASSCCTFRIKVKNFIAVIFIDLVNAQMRECASTLCKAHMAKIKLFIQQPKNPFILQTNLYMPGYLNHWFALLWRNSCHVIKRPGRHNKFKHSLIQYLSFYVQYLAYIGIKLCSFQIFPKLSFSHCQEDSTCKSNSYKTII